MASSVAQLSGLRTLATTWIVLGHFAAEPRGLTARFLSRGHVAVSLYIVLSGFVTHLAYGTKTFSTWPERGRFYLRRFGRIWLTYYVSCVLGLVQRSLTHEVLPAREYVLPLLLLDSWRPTARLDAAYPNLNPAGWTLSTLMLPWLAYPFLNAAFRRVPARPKPIIALMLLFVIGAIAPALCLYLVRVGRGAPPGEVINRAESLYLYQFPPMRLCEFLLGMASSQLLRVEGLMEWRGWPWVGWASAAAIFVSSATVPYEYLGRVDHEAIFISACSPAWALVLLACNTPVDSSSLVRTLRHPVLSSIGAYSFAVYLFQWLWYYAWYGVEMVSDPSVSTPGVWAAYLPAYFACLWVSAALWTERVEAPFAAALKQLLMGPPAKSAAGQPVEPAQKRSCVLVHTSRVAAALLVGVGVLSWMHWATPVFGGPVSNSTSNASSDLVIDELPMGVDAQVAMLRFEPGVQPKATLLVSDNSSQCLNWRPRVSPAAATSAFAEASANAHPYYVPASTSDEHFRLQGRWVDEADETGATTDTANAVIRFRVVNASSIGVLLHSSCGTRQGMSAIRPDLGDRQVDCNAWEGLNHVTRGTTGSLVDVFIDGSFTTVLHVNQLCGVKPSRDVEKATFLPQHHVLHQISGLHRSLDHIFALVSRTDVKSGGLTLRGLVLPEGARLVAEPRPQAPARVVSIGGSWLMGHGVLSERQELTTAQYAGSTHSHYSWPSQLAQQLGYDYFALGFGGLTPSDVTSPLMEPHDSSTPSHQWYLDTLFNNKLNSSTMDFVAEEAVVPTRLIVLDVSTPEWAYAWNNMCPDFRARLCSGGHAQLATWNAECNPATDDHFGRSTLNASAAFGIHKFSSTPRSQAASLQPSDATIGCDNCDVSEELTAYAGYMADLLKHLHKLHPETKFILWMHNLGFAKYEESGSSYPQVGCLRSMFWQTIHGAACKHSDDLCAAILDSTSLDMRILQQMPSQGSGGNNHPNTMWNIHTAREYRAFLADLGVVPGRPSNFSHSPALEADPLARWRYLAAGTGRSGFEAAGCPVCEMYDCCAWH